MNDQPTLFDAVIEPDTSWQPTAPNGEPIGKTLTTRRDDFGLVVTWIPTPAAMGSTTPPTKLARDTDPTTSKQAAENASRRGPSQRRRVWEALQQLGDATDYELSIKTGILRSSAAKRRQELQDLGHVIETPRRRPTDTGTLAVVWRCSYVSQYSGR
jgi:hypothetical protein